MKMSKQDSASAQTTLEAAIISAIREFETTSAGQMVIGVSVTRINASELEVGAFILPATPAGSKRRFRMHAAFTEIKRDG